MIIIVGVSFSTLKNSVLCKTKKTFQVDYPPSGVLISTKLRHNLSEPSVAYKKSVKKISLTTMKSLKIMVFALTLKTMKRAKSYFSKSISKKTKIKVLS